jgi:hypothetical protein
MRNRPKLAPLFALTLAAPALAFAVLQPTTAQACGSYAPSYQGVIKSIDRSRGKVVIRYESDAAHSTTTAVFSAFDREQLAQLRLDDRVVFELASADDGGRFALQSIRVLSHAQTQG